MTVSRYTFSKRKEGTVAPSNASYIINKAARTGAIQVSTEVMESGARLDQIAGRRYGDSSLWWIIAAASGIGWGLQVPPGVVLRIPTSPEDAVMLLL